MASLERRRRLLGHDVPRLSATEYTTDKAIGIAIGDRAFLPTVSADRNGLLWALSDVNIRKQRRHRDHRLRHLIRQNEIPAKRSAAEVVKFFVENILLSHGAPDVLIMDSRMAFTPERTQVILNYSQTSHRRTTAYDQETNGLTERLNETLANIITTHVTSN